MTNTYLFSWHIHVPKNILKKPKVTKSHSNCITNKFPFPLNWNFYKYAFSLPLALRWKIQGLVLSLYPLPRVQSFLEFLHFSGSRRLTSSACSELAVLGEESPVREKMFHTTGTYTLNKITAMAISLTARATVWLILGRVLTLHSYVPASRASVELITNVQSSARIRGLKQYCQNILCSKATIGGNELVFCLCDLQSDSPIRAILKTTSTYFCKSIEISKKFAKHLGFPLFVEIKFSRFNLTWRTAAKEVNLQHALQDKLFIVGQQSSEKCARFSSSGCYLRNPPHPTTLLSEVIVWKFRPAHTVYISVWHCQHFLRLPC